jgi:hypothetical protein
MKESKLSCECQARQHRLLRNCLACGFICCQEYKDCDRCPWCQVLFSNSDNTDQSHWNKLHELLARDEEKETTVLDSEAADFADTPLASFLSGNVDEERERLQELERKMHEARMDRLKASLSAFLPSL